MLSLLKSYIIQRLSESMGEDPWPPSVEHCHRTSQHLGALKLNKSIKSRLSCLQYLYETQPSADMILAYPLYWCKYRMKDAREIVAEHHHRPEETRRTFLPFTF